MKHLISTAASAALLLAAAAANAHEARPLAAGWRFVREDVPGAQAIGFDDRAWSNVAVPHTYNIANSGLGGTKARGEPEEAYYRGPAWYRLRFTDSPRPGRRYYLEFDGAALHADVYLNGMAVGAHQGGYAAFRLDVTDALRLGENLLAVRVDNRKDPHFAPLSGDFFVFGGLYRPVKLVEASDLHLELLDHAGPGVYASTTALAPGRAEVRVRSLVRNDRSTAASFELVTRIVDAAGKVVAERRTPKRLGARQGGEAVETFTLNRPHLWGGRADPYLYRVTTEVRDGGAVVDSQTVPLGVRTVAIARSGEFLLNGRPYDLHGADMQMPTRFGKGPIVSDAEIDEDMRIMWEMGVTGLRLAHMQHPQRVYDDADRLGILLTTEVPLIGSVDMSDAFRENIVQQMQELIAQTSDHPSVAVWGIGNELGSTGAEAVGANRVLAELQTTAKAMDPSRPTAYSHCCLKDDDPIAGHADAISYNRYFGWYWGKSEEIGKWADDLHAQFPNRPIGISEYGAGASVNQQEDPASGQPNPNSYWHPEQYQAVLHEAHWREMAKRPYLWSKFIWVAFDFPSQKRDEGDRPAINDKGLVTEDRMIRKDAYYWYQANWAEAPMLHIASARDVNKRVSHVQVKAYTNLPQIAFSLNGGPAQIVKVEDHVARWETDLRVGDNVVTATASAGGEPLTDSVRWSFAPRP